MPSQTNSPLPDGLEIGGYRILRKIASGGFSIVYLAQDAEGIAYAIKEYLPATLVSRTPGELRPVVAAEHLNTYRNGLKCFFEEGRALARILHPNVVRVVNFLRANDTVYLVMAHEEGRTLQELILRRRANASPNAGGTGQVIAERHIRRIFHLVMNGLREVHANRLLHLDVKPANVYLRLDASPMLLDFGAARQTLSLDAPRLFPMYTPGFAAPELYRRGMTLGPWTDVYGLGATMLACMIGMPPQAADQRQVADRIDDMLDRARDNYSDELVDTVDWCLALDPMDRPQSVFALQRALRAARGEVGGHESPRTTLGGLSRFVDTVVDALGRRRRDSVADNLLS
jgi:serine/threonine protein kinase